MLIHCYYRPFRKNKKKGETPAEEIADLWIKKTFFITAKKLPYIQRRAAIVDTKEVCPPPILQKYKSYINTSNSKSWNLSTTRSLSWAQRTRKFMKALRSMTRLALTLVLWLCCWKVIIANQFIGLRSAFGTNVFTQLFFDRCHWRGCQRRSCALQRSVLEPCFHQRQSKQEGTNRTTERFVHRSNWGLRNR